MMWLRLALANLGLSPLTSAVNVALMGLGTASIVLLLLAGTQLAATLSRDARGIDLVLGANGSPVQLVLAAVYHADIPPGNIRQADAERWAQDPRVQTAIPLALGDSFQGFRIVGTSSAYPDLYGATPAEGRFWLNPMEATIGSAVAASVGLTLGDRFAGAHGLVESGQSHESSPYRVVGVLEATGTVVDRLILTSLESVWALHDNHNHLAHSDARARPPHGEQRDQHAGDDITAMLIRYRSPLAAATLPREVNASGSLQGASPAMEISRVLQLVGVGLDGLKAFSWVLIATAALSVFAALYGSLRARRGDLAMLRCLGASRWELLWVLLLEGLLLSVFGVTLGFLIGHSAMEVLGGWLEATRGVALTGWVWLPAETLLLVSLFTVGIFAAAIPAVQAYRTDVARTLAES
ncbi:MAG: ABC transporter permease [Pseudomonadota bacterium]